MSNRNIKIATVAVIAAVAIAFCGCSQSSQSDKSRPLNLKNEMPVKLSCVVSIGQNDGSRYFTKQKQLFYPEQNGLIFSANEPEGAFSWSVTDDSYTRPKASKLPQRAKLMFSRQVSAALLALYTANTADLSQAGKTGFSLSATINIDGRIYERLSKNNGISLYRNRQSGKIDTVKTTGKGSYIIQGYNYHKIANSELVIPTKVDVFVLKTGQNKQFAAQFSIFID